MPVNHSGIADGVLKNSSQRVAVWVFFGPGDVSMGCKPLPENNLRQS